MEKVVSTLPITSRNRISNAKVQGIITGGLLAHHLGADFTPWLGLNGRNSDTSVSAQNLFSTIALAYGPKILRIYNQISIRATLISYSLVRASSSRMVCLILKSLSFLRVNVALFKLKETLWIKCRSKNYKI